jgi:NADH dehydrogenase [ubiquinone] 1 alpha subcomplex assembly factor 2
MQWLRHTRFDPPTLAEQQQDMIRQERMKLLAAEADARWASKPSALDAPDKQQPMQALKSKDPESAVTKTNVTEDPSHRAEASRIMEEGDVPVPRKGNLDAETVTPVSNESVATGSVPAFTQKKTVTSEPKNSPWKQAASANPGQEWQPQKWTPAPAKRRE